MGLTDYHAKLFASELTRRCGSEEIDRLAPVLVNDADKGQLRSDTEKRQLELQLEHVLLDRTEQDLLYEILLKDGFELTTPVETLDLLGFRVHSIADGQMLLCLQDKLTLELIRAMADRKLTRIVCLDRGFRDNDQLKANAAKIFASKGVEKFKTV